MGDDIWYGDLYAGAWHFNCNETLFQKAMLCTLYLDEVDDLKYLLASHKWGEKNLISSINKSIEILLVNKQTGLDPVEKQMDENIGHTIWSFIRTEPDFDINEEQLYAVGSDYTPLSYALIYSKPKCLKWLLALPGIDLNVTKKFFEVDRKLRDAERDANFEIVNSLLDAGVDINAKNEKGWTYLHYRVLGMRSWDKEPQTRNMLRNVRYLLGLDTIDVNVQNDNGDTPFMLAVKYNKIEAAKMLLEAKADLTVQNNEGHTWKSIPIPEEYQDEGLYYDARESVKKFFSFGSWNYFKGSTTTISAVYAGPSHMTEPILWLAANVDINKLDCVEYDDGNIYIKTNGGWVHVEGDLASPPWSKEAL